MTAAEEVAIDSTARHIRDSDEVLSRREASTGGFQGLPGFQHFPVLSSPDSDR